MSSLSDAREQIAENPRQQEAFEARGHCMVVAPPGSGKTKLLTTRLAQDFVDEIHPPHGAACITYGTAAAAELAARLRSLGVKRRANLFVGTVHGFALNAIIRPYAPLVGQADVLEARVADKDARKRIMNEAIDAVYDEYENTFAVDTTVERRRRHIEFADDEAMFGGERIAEVARRYEEGLAAEGIIDFDDMVRIAVELVRDHEFVRKALTARFPMLYIDEYQDLGPGLHYLVNYLCFDERASSTLFAVADPEQCIYVFSGAAPELVEEVAERPDVTDVSLEVNYRCSEEIIRQSMTALDQPIKVEGLREGGTVAVHKVEGWVKGQAREALRLIKEAIGQNTPLEKIAVICVTNKECQEAAEILREGGLPVFVRTSDQYATTPATQFLEGAAEWVSVPRGEAGFSLADLLASWRGLLADKWERASAIELVSYLLSIEDGAATLARDFVERIAAMRLMESLSDRIEGQESADSIDVMLKNFASGESLDGLTISELGDRAQAKNRVHVITMHGSKGLEFDYVYILGLEYNRLPRWNAADWEIIQARRQFYVALTRARHSVRMYYTGWTVDKYKRRHEDGPSRFVRKLLSAGKST